MIFSNTSRIFCLLNRRRNGWDRRKLLHEAGTGIKEMKIILGRMEKKNSVYRIRGNGVE